MSGGDWLGLAGQVCVVTGAGSGIGAAIAENFVRVGAHVALLDRDGAACQRVAQQLTESGGRVIGIECDISDEAACRPRRTRVKRNSAHALGWSITPACSALEVSMRYQWPNGTR